MGQTMTKPTLLVLAAGIGSRYGGFKQVDPVGPHGEIVLDYAVFDAWRAGFGKVVFVIQPDLEAPMREHFGPRLAGRLASEYVFQELDDLPGGFRPPAGRTKPWGTGHAIWSARGKIDEPFASINADDFYGRTSYRVLAEFLTSPERNRNGQAFCMVAFKLSNTLSEHGTVSRGVCSKDGTGALAEVVERTSIEPAPGGGARYRDAAGNWQPLTGDELASMNIWGFSPKLFPALEQEFVGFLGRRGMELKSEFYIPSVVDTLIKQGRFKTAVLSSDDKWFGMTYREDRPLVAANIRALIQQGVYPERLWA